jgi:hypothetical protein
MAFLDVRGPCDVFLDDNLFFDVKGALLPVTTNFRDPQLNYSSPEASQHFRREEKPMFWPPRLKAKPATETKDWVLANVGARPWERDAIDQRLVDEARSGGGKIIHNESEVGGGAPSGK